MTGRDPNHAPARVEATSRRLLQLGFVLFLLGLLTGFAVPIAANPRMALSSHLEGLLNGIFLLVVGLIWERLQLGARARATAFWLVVYGTFANWATTLAAAVLGAGASMMPLAGGGQSGSSAQEMVIGAGLLSLSVAMVVVCPILLYGLRGAVPIRREAGEQPASRRCAS